MKIIKLLRLYDTTHESASFQVLSWSEAHGNDIVFTVCMVKYHNQGKWGDYGNVRQFIHDRLGYMLPTLFTSRGLGGNDRFKKFSYSLVKLPVIFRVIWTEISRTKPRWFSIRHFAQFSWNGRLNLFLLPGYLSDPQPCILRP